MLTRRRFLSQASRCSAALAAGQLLPQQQTPPFAGSGPLRAHAAAHGLFYGAAVDIAHLRRDSAYRALLAEQCNILVAENAMKWQAVHPAPETYSFDQADQIVAFAEQHRIAVRGHNLCWHEGLPGWLTSTATTANAAQLLTAHIRTVAGRYRGRVRAWDVVNEAIDVKSGRPDNLRDSPWLRLAGPGYLDLAFRTARQVDPHALLTYNEYGIEYDNPDSIAKRAAVLALLRRFKVDGTPIDALGIQSHLDATMKDLGPGLLAFAAEVRALGLKIFITEMDVNDDKLDDPTAGDYAARDRAVAETYGRYVYIMTKLAGVTDILTWGLSDNHTWLNDTKTHKAEHPARDERDLPFDGAYQPKPAAYALRAALGDPKD